MFELTSYEILEDKIVSACECSLESGMKTILDIPEEDYPVLLEICKNNGYDSYVPYVAERLEQLIEWRTSNG